MLVKLETFPKFRGENKKYLSCHHLVVGDTFLKKCMLTLGSSSLIFATTLFDIFCSLDDEDFGSQKWRSMEENVPFQLGDFLGFQPVIFRDVFWAFTTPSL